MLMPVGVRPRQLRVRTLLLGMLLCLDDHRPAHLVRVHASLVGLCERDRVRLGVVAEAHSGPHLLTYRQVERTARLVAAVLDKQDKDGTPSEMLLRLEAALLEASVTDEYKAATRSLAVDWTDIETFSCPPVVTGGSCADTEASWGHRRGDAPGQTDEVFFGYYLQLATMTEEEGGPGVPELVRRMALTSCHIDPPRYFVYVIVAMAGAGIEIGDVICDSGYAHRIPEHWALVLRMAGANIVTDLHPSDRGPKGTFQGAILNNGSLYCPATPKALFGLQPLRRGADADEVAHHDRMTAEADRYRLGRVTDYDADGYHRVACPAVAGKLRCPHRPASMALGYDHPEIAEPPEELPACCVQKTITVPPQVNAKTAQSEVGRWISFKR